jgi:hypothetical protein
MQATAQQRPKGWAEASGQSDETSARIEQNASRVLGTHSLFRGRRCGICLECHDHTMIITGRVPSYYLKQVLQEALRQVDGVDKIDNRVDVICCDGLSSPPTQPGDV